MGPLEAHGETPMRVASGSPRSNRAHGKSMYLMVSLSHPLLLPSMFDYMPLMNFVTSCALVPRGRWKRSGRFLTPGGVAHFGSPSFLTLDPTYPSRRRMAPLILLRLATIVCQLPTGQF
jgi:hypothetical protein